MPRKGCRECLYRRIECDETDPSCQKCAKKGIECSGVGKFRFVTSSSRRGRGRASSTTTQIRGTTHSSGTKRRPSRSNAENATDSSSTRQTTSDVTSEQQLWTPANSESITPGVPPQTPPAPQGYDLRADLAMEVVSSGAAVLLMTFSQSIASIMVIFDCGFNGYRDVLLQLAFTDPLVQRAVCVCSALFLGLRNPALYQIAERRRSAIITELSSLMKANCPGNTFNISTFSTVLILLVGETVTGSDEFGPLYRMLAALSQNDATFDCATVTSRAFFAQQMKMFQLFTPPMLGSQALPCASNQDLEPYVEFLVGEQTQSPELAPWALVYKAAFLTACDIYRIQRRPIPDLASVELMVSSLRALTQPLQQDTPGMHALVWVYFIAAASTQDAGNQAFFANKMWQIYDKTHMNNIIVAVERLEEMWMQRQDDLPTRLQMIRPVLAI